MIRRGPDERSPEELRRAAEDCRYALRYISLTSPGYSSALAIKGTALLLLSLERQDPALLEEAEQARRRVLAIQAPGEPGRSEALVDLIACLRFRWHQDNEADVLVECAELGRELVDLPMNDTERRLTAQFWGGQALHSLAVESRDTELLTVAVTVLRVAAITADGQHDEWRGALARCELSAALLNKHQSGRDVRALHEALGVATVAATIFAATTDQADLVTTALTYRMRAAIELAEATGDQQMMIITAQLARDAPKRATEQAVDPLPFHVQLVDILRRFHILTGDREWLWQAVVAARDAKAAAPSDHPDRPGILAQLCATLLDHYETQPNHTILSEAVREGQEAYQSSQADDPERGHYLHAFGKALYLIGAGPYANRRQYIKLAVAVTEEALDAIPTGHPERWSILGLLGACLHRSFKLGGPIEHVSRAVEMTREALRMLPPDDRNHAASLSNLATYLYTIAGHEDSVPRLEEALDTTRRAVTAAPNDGTTLLHLGYILRELYEKEHRRRDDGKRVLVEARSAFSRAVDTDNLTPAARIDAYRSLAWTHLIARTAQEPALALEAYERAIELLPHISSRLLWRRERQMGLARTSGLAAEAASAAVIAGRPERAAELLEQARGTLLTETMDRRGIRDILEDHDPELAEHYDTVLQYLELYDADPRDLVLVKLDLESDDPLRAQGFRAGGEDGVDHSSVEAVYRQAYAQTETIRRNTEQLLNYLLPRIRCVPGLDMFMQPLSAAMQRQEATDGPIVLINTSRYRTDALIITEHKVRNVQLENVDLTAIVDQTAQLNRALESVASPSLRDRQEGQLAISNLLGWLWDNITGPVLDALGYTESPQSDDGWPRIWWCPIGDAAPLPLHAAGHHDEHAHCGQPRTVLDRVVSSYTPTIRALRQARRAGVVRAEAGRQDNALIVAVSELPETDDPALHGAIAEADRVSDLIPNSRQLIGANANYMEVSAALQSHSLVHFACHGVSDWTDPDASQLLLHDHDEYPFTLGIVAKTHHPGAALAYLSACETTQGTPDLHDEAIHITSAFQLAGYRQVVGTLWPVDDEAARHIANAFYTTLTKGGTEQPRPEHASRALHHAVRELRTRCMGKSPSLWAAHIHAGA